jgi:hypothetical protein
VRLRLGHAAPAVCHGFERQTRFGMQGVAAGKGLPTPDRDVDIAGVDLQGPSMPTDAFGGEQSGAGAGKGVEDDAVALRTVLDGISNQRHRFNGRMGPQVIHPTSGNMLVPTRFAPVPNSLLTGKLTGNFAMGAVATHQPAQVGGLRSPERAISGNWVRTGCCATALTGRM